MLSNNSNINYDLLKLLNKVESLLFQIKKIDEEKKIMQFYFLIRIFHEH
jgi:hypothetical protein